MDFNQLKARLGRDGLVVVGGALLIFIDSFLPWYKVSLKGNEAFAGGASASTNGWGSGIGAWFPILLLVAVGVVVVLAAMGNIKWSPLMTYTIAAGASVVSFVIIVLRWLTYPSPNALEKAYVNAGAGFGTYIALVVALAMAVFAYLGFSSVGGDVKNIGAGFQQNQAGPPANQG